MIIAISNLRDNVLSNLQINFFKKMHGIYTVSELSSMIKDIIYKQIIIDITAIKDYQNTDNLKDFYNYFDMNKVVILLDGTFLTTSNEYISKLVSIGIYNFANNESEIISLINKPNTKSDVIKSDLNITENNSKIEVNINARVICFKNLTEHAGSSTLIYMLKKKLESKFSVCALEINKNDFSYFNSKNMYSTVEINLADTLCKLDKEFDIILIDINNSNINNCGETIYLLEPSILKLNKMLSRNNNIFGDMRNKFVLLNKNVLSSKDIKLLENELKISIFYTLPNLNDRDDNIEITNFINRIGFKY